MLNGARPRVRAPLAPRAQPRSAHPASHLVEGAGSSLVTWVMFAVLALPILSQTAEGRMMLGEESS